MPTAIHGLNKDQLADKLEEYIKRLREPFDVDASYSLYQLHHTTREGSDLRFRGSTLVISRVCLPPDVIKKLEES